MIGYNDNEIESSLKEWDSRVHLDDKEKVYQDLQEHFDGKTTTYSNEHRVLCKDGTYKWILDRGEVIHRDLEGFPLRMIGTHTDVTERKLYEKKLLEKTKLLDEAQRLTSLGSWSLNLTTNHLKWSDEIYNIFEIDKKESPLSYEDFLDLIHPEDRLYVDQTYKNSLKNKTKYDIVHRLLLLNKKVKFVREIGNTIYDIDNNPIFSSGTVQDITKEKLLENTLIEKRNFISKIIENANVIICVVDSTGTMIKINKYGEEFTGYKRENIASHPYFWSIFLPKEIQKDVTSIITKAKNGIVIKSYQNPWISKYGVERVFEWSNTLVDKEDGSMDYILSIGIDITKNKEMEKELIKSKEESENENKNKSIFLSNISHEIRTPLNSILGFVDILKENIKDDVNKKYLDTINDSSEHLLNVINDILDINKIENNKLLLCNKNFDSKKEFTNILNSFKAKIDEKNIHLIENIDINIPCTLNGDIFRLKQVILNLLSNAVKFTTNNKKIVFSARYENKSIFISVKDEGIGIAKNKQSKIFDEFTQANHTTSSEYGGTGLGLNISSKLVELLGGILKVKSKLSHGSEFYFHIPIMTSNKNIKDVNINDKCQNINFSNKKILLAEDSYINQLLMKAIFEKLSILYDIASDGYEAVFMYKNNKYDTILMDDNMQHMNGVKATKKIREYEKEKQLNRTPIIALTANALKNDKERFLNADMDEYLSKPLDKNKLIEVLNKFLR